MEIILTQEIYKLGNPGDVVKVADGYARNYLLPQNFAISATSKNLKKIEGIREEAEKQRQAMLNELKAMAKQLAGVTLKYTRKADENGHLYGSVSEIDIAASLEEKGIELHKTMIILDKHLKTIGEFDVQIHLTRDLDASVKVQVRDEEGRLEMEVEEEPEPEVVEEAAPEAIEEEVAPEAEVEVEAPATEETEEVSS